MDDGLRISLGNCVLRLWLDDAQGTRQEGVVHVESTGLVGVSNPVGVQALDVAAAAIPLLRQVMAALEARVADPASWVTALGTPDSPQTPYSLGEPSGTAPRHTDRRG